MRSLHKWVIAIGTAGLAFLCMVGAKANADNFVRTPTLNSASIHRTAATIAMDNLRHKVREANTKDRGCGG